MVDPRALSRYARIRRRERATVVAVRKALGRLLVAARRQLAGAGWNPDVFDDRMPEWRAAVDEWVVPEVTESYLSALREQAGAMSTTDATAYAARHLEQVSNRLVGTARAAFDEMRQVLRDGWLAGDDIPTLAGRVDDLLADDERWTNRAVTIARTETIGANNAGARDGARVTATRLGVESGVVVKEWLATPDERTRPTHREASGQQVAGIEAPFTVGGVSLLQPGDPSGSGREVINCRCTCLYLMPGDPGYPLTAGGTMSNLTAAGPEDDPDPTDDVEANTSTVIVALPDPDDPIHTLVHDSTDGAHATLLWFGDVDNDTADTIRDAVVAVIDANSQPFPQDTANVEALGDDDPQAIVLRMSDDAPDLEYTLAAFRERLLEDPAVRAAFDAVKQWPTYTPHITLGYGDEVTDDERDTAETLTEISFDRLAVWQADRKDEYPLASTQPASTPDTEDEAMTAAPVEQPTPADVGTVTDLTWTGVLAVEGQLTGDGRKFREGAIHWMGTPGVLHAMFDGGSGFGGHEDAVPVGLIVGVERRGNDLWGHGTWGTTEEASKARAMNIEGLLRGVSVDLDDVEVSFEMEDGTPLEGDELFDVPPDEQDQVVLVIDEGRLRGATLWTIPAFVEAYVLDSTVADQVPDTSIVNATERTGIALAAAGAITPTPLKGTVPASAFAYPGEDNLHAPDGTPLGMVVTDDRRIFGYVATWGTCHIGIDGTCVTPPTSETGYASFLTGEYPTSDDQVVPVGTITMDTGHAPLDMRPGPAVAHYDDTGTAAAYVGCGEDSTGIWYAGVLAPGLPDDRQLALRAAGRLSGDWRRIGGNLEMVAALGVNVGGFPIPKVQTRVASGVQTALVASGIPKPATQAMVSEPQLRAMIAAAVRRHQRRESLHRTIRGQRRQAAVARLGKVV